MIMCKFAFCLKNNHDMVENGNTAYVSPEAVVIDMEADGILCYSEGLDSPAGFDHREI